MKWGFCTLCFYSIIKFDQEKKIRFRPLLLICSSPFIKSWGGDRRATVPPIVIKVLKYSNAEIAGTGEEGGGLVLLLLQR